MVVFDASGICCVVNVCASRSSGNDVLCRAAQVYLEDAGFDWKILGPDVSDFEYVAWQCDQDAYAATGQKCSAQSILFQHSNWVNKGNFEHSQAPM